MKKKMNPEWETMFLEKKEQKEDKTYSVNKFNQLSIIIFINFLVLIIIEVNIFKKIL
ncbi:hypothetical protein SAP269_21930 (plasmid) [Spiroplasma ixodetis]|uniref:Spiroplasmavirus-related protein n=1 Tax=Spiroplasma ixodetis TaxID=2141 RepID=A0ABM8JUM2_9MOLU